MSKTQTANPSTSKTTNPKAKALVDTLKKMHSAEAIEKKDFSLSDLFDSKTKEVTLDIIGLASKLVPKYRKTAIDENGEQVIQNPGYHTMVYLKDGKKTGAFASSLFYFANFFYEKAGMDVNSNFNKIMFDGDLSIKVSEVELDGGRKTYNFEILDGEIDGVERIGKSSGSALLLTATTPAETSAE